MKAVIMAGGEGTRLRPLTCTAPKPMLPLVNRPVLQYVIDLLVRHGIDTVVLTLHYLAEEVMSYFGDGSDFGVKIIYSLEDEPLGTAGSIKKIEEYLDDTFLVISGDGLTDIDLGRIIAFHKEKQAIATLTLKRVEKPVEYGVVITDEGHRIRRFLEKPSWGEVFSDQVNTGIYVLEPDILKLMEPNRAYDFSRDIFPQLLDHPHGLYGYVAGGYWCDMGDLDNFRRSVRDLFQGNVLHELVGREIRSRCWVGDGTKIHPSAELEGPLLIGKNCRIGAGVHIGPFTCIGSNSIIEDNAYLDRAILFQNVFFGKLSRGTNCIVGKHVTVKSSVTLGDNCVIGDNCFLGRGSEVCANVKIWPNKDIADGNTIALDVIWGRLASVALFGQTGVIGLGNIEITPEFAMRLGAAFGTLLPKGSAVMTSRDSHPAARLINRSIITGLTSVGINVLDSRLNPAPVTRYLINSGEAKGGVHTRIYRDDARYIEIQFFDERGVNLDKNMERKIENGFVRQDFRRTYMDDVGEISYTDKPIDTYLQHFLKHIDVEAVRSAHLKIVIDHGYGSASMVLPSLLSRLGVETINLNAYIDVDKANALMETKQQSLQQLSNIVAPLHANLGLLLDADGESLSVVDETGKIISGDQLLAMSIAAVLHRKKDTVVAVPVNASRILDCLAEDGSVRIVRTKTDLRSLMHTAAVGEDRLTLAGTPSGYFCCPAFSPSVDAIFFTCFLLQLIIGEGQPISQLVARIPSQHSLHDSVDCKWKAKAKVMRLLVELYREQLLEMLDGVRMRFPDGVGMVIPHPTLARLQLWVDGDSDEAAARIMETLKKDVKRLESSKDEMFKLQPNDSKIVIGTNVVLPEDRAFHFWIPGRYLGIQARSIRTFIDVLRYVEITSLEFHAGRHDFSNWIASELHNSVCATSVATIERELRGNALRTAMITCLSNIGEPLETVEDLYLGSH